MEKIITKNHIPKLLISKIKRDITAWQALKGIWKGKKLKDPIKWQREIRKEWERKLL